MHLLEWIIWKLQFIADKMRYESIKKKEDFTFETVLSSDYKMEIIKKSLKKKDTLLSVYLFLQ